MPSSARLPLLAFFLWTLFVWGGRIRNALGDDALTGTGRAGTLLLAASFVVPAVLLGAGWLVSRGARPQGELLVRGTVALAAWTVAVWVVRGGDILLGGDHEVGFVVVHLVLAIVSSALAVVTAVVVRGGRRSESFAQVGR